MASASLGYTVATIAPKSDDLVGGERDRQRDSKLKPFSLKCNLAFVSFVVFGGSREAYRRIDLRKFSEALETGGAHISTADGKRIVVLSGDSKRRCIASLGALSCARQNLWSIDDRRLMSTIIRIATSRTTIWTSYASRPNTAVARCLVRLTA